MVQTARLRRGLPIDGLIPEAQEEDYHAIIETTKQHYALPPVPVAPLMPFDASFEAHMAAMSPSKDSVDPGSRGGSGGS